MANKEFQADGFKKLSCREIFCGLARGYSILKN